MRAGGSLAEVGAGVLIERRGHMALAILLEQAVRLIYPERSPQAMHPGQWAALRYLARTNREAATVAGLARYLGVTLAPASRAAAALVRKGYVRGEPDERDRRVVRLSLTAEGLTLLGGDPIRRLADAVSQLPDDRQRELAAILEHLFAQLSPGSDEGHDGPSFTLDD